MTRQKSEPARLCLLGGFQLWDAGQELPVCAASQRLLAYLAVAAGPRTVRRGPLAERLWSDLPPQRATSSLRTTLWRLPKLDGRELVQATSSTVRLQPDLAVDLWGMRNRTATGAETPPSDVGALMHDLLPDWSDDWLLVEQESYRQARLHALEALSHAWCVAHRYEAALQAGLAAVRCEPLRETAHRRVIEAHLAEGNYAEALRQFHAFRRLLADELGLPPSPAVRRLVAPLLGRPVDGHVTRS